VRVLAACSLGGAGHLRPLLPLLDAAVRQGHDVLVVAPPAMAAMVEATGHVFRAGGEPAEAEIAPLRERLPLLPPAEAAAVGDGELFGRLATQAMLPAMTDAVAAWRPDLVLREPCEHASTLAATRAGVPLAQVAISPADVEWGAIGTAAAALARLGADVEDEMRAMPYLTRFPAALDPSPFPGTVRFHAPRPPADPLPDWWGGSTAPLVYLTFGTVLGFMSIAAEVYRAAVEALADLDARVLLTVGRRFDAAALGPAPAHVRVEPWVEQDRVLAEAALVVCHGGSGTVYGALAAGVPVVTVPVFADQFENGRRVAAAGAGLTVDAERGSGVDVPRLAAAVEQALADPALARRAREIAADIAATPPADAVVAELLGAARPPWRPSPRGATGA
jgi:UDP:flavonoid glycosyltransferase YjiC (YdhE family)